MINVDLTGYCLINNEDAWAKYSIGFEQGTFPELLKAPKRKDLYARVWADKNGTQRFSKNIFFESKTLSLPVFIIGTDKDDLAVKYSAFKSFMETSGYFTLEFPDLGQNYKLLYDDMPDFNLETAYTKDGDVVARFKLSLTDDFPVEHSIFRAAFEAAKAAGYTVDSQMFDQAVSADLPYSYQKEAEVILAPGISKSGKVAGVDRNGNIVEFTATRAGTATYIGKDGLLKTAAANEPRIDYSSGQARYLIEAAATNFIRSSRNVSASGTGWSSANLNRTVNAATALDGTNTATLCEITDGVSTSNLGVLFGSLDAGNYVFSFYLKMGTKRGGYRYRVYDNTNAVELTAPSASTYTNQLVAGKFVRIEVPFMVAANGTSISVFVHSENGSVIGSFVVDGVQVETGTVATSGISTNGASGVRAADVMQSVSTALIGYPSASIMYIDKNMSIDANNSIYVSKDTNNVKYFYGYSTNIRSSNGVDTLIVNPRTNNKNLLVFDSVDGAVFNGGATNQHYLLTSPNFSASGKLVIGSSSAAITKFSLIAIFSRKFTDTEAITLTK